MGTLRFARRARIGVGLFIGTFALSPLQPGFGSTARADSPAAFSTFDAVRGGCQDSPNGVNCNHYLAKEDVYLNGGPVGAALADGDYYFAILPPGYQNGGFFEGAPGNLSDTTAGGTAGDSGKGDAQANRTFHVSGGFISYAGTHHLGVDPQGKPVIQAAPFDDTNADGGNYILAICSVGATSASDCKFDEFQVVGTTDGGTASDGGTSAGGGDGGTASDGGFVPGGGGGGSLFDEPPIASCQPVTVCANSACQASASVNNGSYDPDNAIVALSQSPAGPYGLGTQTVTLSISADGKTATCSAPVTVNDCTPPQIQCPAAVSAECSSNGQASVAMPDATATDNCVAPGITQAGTQSYPLGSTTVGYTATDGAGNASSCTTTVTVVDTTPPQISCPTATTAECTGNSSANVTPGQATASDSCTSATVSGPSAGTYPLGSTRTSYTATDRSGNTASCSSSVTVVDTTPPAITCPAPVTTECTGNASAYVTPGQASATDSCTAASLAQASAGTYPLGSTTLAYAASDTSGNKSSCTSTATVVDTTPPQIACPAPVTAECTGNLQAVVDPGHAAASDICTTAVVAEPGPGSYPLGSSAVTHTASDLSGNQSACLSLVTVVDTTPPSITCPAAITAECTGNAQAVVDTGAASASDSCSPVTVSDPAPASYPLGTSTVTHSAADTSNNKASCSASVTVVDTTPPAITCPASVTAECTGNNQAVVDSGHASATDICTTASVSEPAPASYPLGTTAVTHSATDQSGNTSSCQNDVNVVDTTPPQITVSGGPQLWPPDHKYVLVGLDSCGVAINDVCNGSLTLDQSAAGIVSVTSDEVVLATGVGSGHTDPDIVIVDPTHVNLRAERAGTGDGRVYTIHFKAKDSSGNWGAGACQVTVPHDQSPSNVVVDSGVQYTVTYP